MKFILFCIIGILYGVVLTLAGLGAANGGDGAMLPLYVFGSPLFYPLLFFAPIVVWGLVGVFLGGINERKYERGFIAIMGIHYLGVLSYTIFLGDWNKIERLSARSPASIVLLVLLYTGGQILIWTFYKDQRWVDTRLH